MASFFYTRKLWVGVLTIRIPHWDYVVKYMLLIKSINLIRVPRSFSATINSGNIINIFLVICAAIATKDNHLNFTVPPELRTCLKKKKISKSDIYSAMAPTSLSHDL